MTNAIATESLHTLMGARLKPLAQDNPMGWYKMPAQSTARNGRIWTMKVVGMMG